MFRSSILRLGLVLFGLAGLALPGMWAEAGGKKIRVLIIDGQNNHNWKATTPVMKEALEASGKFTVTVATAPTKPGQPQQPKAPTKPKEPEKPKNENDATAMKKFEQAKKEFPKLLKKFEEDKNNFEKNKEKLLAQYEVALADYKNKLTTYTDDMGRFHPDLSKVDVVLSNYNGEPWRKAFQDDLEDRLAKGKVGLVIVHAANNAFTNWVEYNLMIGMGWRGEKFGKRLKLDDQGKAIVVPPGQDLGSGHRYTGPFQITVRDGTHPITKGMPQEWMHFNDELYDNMRGPIENVHLLATAHSDKKKNGTGAHEPMIWTVAYGKGRVFHTPMGHDAGSMTCIGFITTLQRGTEWSATGQVTIPIPQNFPTADKPSTVKK